MKKPKFIKEIEKSEGKERAKCGRWYIRVYGELDNKPMVELESLEIIVKELHKLEEENKKLREENQYRKNIADVLPKGKGHIAEETIQDLQARIKELKETIKDHKLYEEKLEHRIIELEELLHGE